MVGATAGRPVLWELGFRPFFLGAMALAPLLMLAWLWAYTSGLAPGGYFPPAAWHSHEMVFGYVVAVMAGFLLTATPNWAGRPTASGGRLAALFAVWLLGRIAVLAGGALPPWLPGAVDVAFLVLLAAAIGAPLVRARQWRNLIFIPVLALLAGLNASMHLYAAGVLPGAAGWPIRLSIWVILLTIVIVAGRVIPFFTERALAGARPRRWTGIEVLSVATLVAAAAADLQGEPRIRLALATAAAAVHAVRWMGWCVRGVWSRPMLWVLFLGYAWIVVGFALEAAAAAGIVAGIFVTHAWTAGAIGTLTMGMMVRVSLGHTGRSVLRGPRAAVWGFALVNAAAAARVLLPLAAPAYYPRLIVLAGGLWIAAFALVLAACGGMLLAPRAK